MLEELYQYAVSHELDARPGFKRKRPKGYFHLSASGVFLDLELRGQKERAVLAPDVGAAANGTKFCNPLIEKAGIPLCMIGDEEKDKNVRVKHDFFLSFLEKGKEAEPLFGAVAKALRSPETRKNMQEALLAKKLKPSDLVGFAADGQYLEKSDRYLDWWEKFRKELQPPSKAASARCLITGNLSQPMATVPKVSGLSRVGGHTSGDAFLCFDKDAFQSYGLKQSANAAVSEEAMTAVNAALERLIQEAETLGGTKMVHWYTGQVSRQEDLINLPLVGELLMGEEDSEEEFDGTLEEGLKRETEGALEEKLEKEGEERDALRAARQLLRSIQEGRLSGKPEFRYYMMPLSGAGGRMMVRGWHEGTYESLYYNVSLWFDDLRLILPNGRGKTLPPKMKALCIRLLKPGGGSKSLWERMDQELKNLAQRMMYAVVEGGPLPDEAAYRALQWLRSDFLSEEKKSRDKAGNPGKTGNAIQEGGNQRRRKQEILVYQVLKAWLRRKQRKEGKKDLMSEELNRENRECAYLCGRLMAVYSTIQERAMPENNVGIAERYFAAAMASPGLVIGKLAQLSQYHLAKLEKGRAVYFEKLLTEIYQAVGGQKIPTALTMMQQTEFALGYYQQRAEIFSGKKQETEDE